MYEQAGVVTLYTETPLHVGSGATVGAVDLPIQREQHTGFPIIPGSGIKGVVRAAARCYQKLSPAEIDAIFGPEGDRGAEHAGALAFADAHLLLFPVRSVFGVFAWTTCPLVLAEVHRIRQISGLPAAPAVADVQSGKALVAPDSQVVRDGRLMLEEFALDAAPTPDVATLARFLAEHVFPQSGEYGSWRARLSGHIVVLADDDWRDFVTYSTEVVARIALDRKTGTTSGPGGNLWYEEHVPSDAVFLALALASRPRLGVGGVSRDDLPRSAADVLTALDRLELDRLQIGGDETVGRGIVKVRLTRPAASVAVKGDQG